jgi:hypothetical protein
MRLQDIIDKLEKIKRWVDLDSKGYNELEKFIKELQDKENLTK